MAFKAGNKANPLGAGAAHSKLTRQLKDILAGDVDDAVEVVRKCLKQEDLHYQTWAAKEVLDRVFGKASQTIDATDDAKTVARAVLQVLAREDEK